MMALRLAAVTVAVAVPLIDPSVAVTMAEPVDTPAARPVAPRVTMFVALELHVTWVVTS